MGGTATSGSAAGGVSFCGYSWALLVAQMACSPASISRGTQLSQHGAVTVFDSSRYAPLCGCGGEGLTAAAPCATGGTRGGNGEAVAIECAPAAHALHRRALASQHPSVTSRELRREGACRERMMRNVAMAWARCGAVQRRRGRAPAGTMLGAALMRRSHAWQGRCVSIAEGAALLACCSYVLSLCLALST